LFYACNNTEPVVHCFTYETERLPDSGPKLWKKETGSDVSTEYIWETFDSLFKTVHRQGRRVEELEARVVELESRLQERSAFPAQQQPPKQFEQVKEMPAEKAA
jgi:hypothetical protein